MLGGERMKSTLKSKIIAGAMILSSIVSNAYASKIDNCDIQYRKCLNSHAVYDPFEDKYYVYGDLEECNEAYISCIKEENKKSYMEDKQTYDQKEDKDILMYLHDLERELGFENNFLVNIAMVESSMNPYAKSKKEAYGILQVREIAFKELKRIYDISRSKVEKYVKKDTLKDVNPADVYTYAAVDLKTWHLSYKDVMDLVYFYTPVYKAIRSHRDLLNKEWNEVKRDPYALAETGALYLFVLKTYLSTLQVIKTPHGNVLIRRPPEHFGKNKNLRIFGDNEFNIWAFYNRGIKEIIKGLKKEGTLYKVINKSPKETRRGMRKLLGLSNES